MACPGPVPAEGDGAFSMAQHPFKYGDGDVVDSHTPLPKAQSRPCSFRSAGMQIPCRDSNIGAINRNKVQRCSDGSGPHPTLPCQWRHGGYQSSLAVLNLVWSRTGTMQRDWSTYQDGESGRDKLTSFCHGGMALECFCHIVVPQVARSLSIRHMPLSSLDGTQDCPPGDHGTDALSSLPSRIHQDQKNSNKC